MDKHFCRGIALRGNIPEKGNGGRGKCHFHARKYTVKKDQYDYYYPFHYLPLICKYRAIPFLVMRPTTLSFSITIILPEASFIINSRAFMTSESGVISHFLLWGTKMSDIFTFVQSSR